MASRLNPTSSSFSSSHRALSRSRSSPPFFPQHFFLGKSVLIDRSFSFTCLLVSFFFYWPVALFFDSKSRLGNVARHPQADEDGPEYLIGTPMRDRYLYDREKTGHRGFMSSVFGTFIGGSFDFLLNHTLFRSSVFSDRLRSPSDRSTSYDTLLMRGIVRDRATGQPLIIKEGGDSVAGNVILSAWQADPRGTGAAKYCDLDLDWDFRGRFKVDARTGAYEFITLYPVTISLRSASLIYLLNALFLFIPSLILVITNKGFRSIEVLRPPHIHFYIDAPGYRRLTTQVYFPDRLQKGEVEEIANTVPVQARNNTTMRPELIVHPKLNNVDADGNHENETKWVVDFDFLLDKE